MAKEPKTPHPMQDLHKKIKDHNKKPNNKSKLKSKKELIEHIKQMQRDIQTGKITSGRAERGASEKGEK